MTRLNSRSKSLVLMGCVSQGSDELCIGPGRLRASVFLWLSHLSSSVESWNADSILSCSKNFERWWRKSIVSVDLRSYRKLLFNFLDWSLSDEVTCAGQHLIYHDFNF